MFTGKQDGAHAPYWRGVRVASAWENANRLSQHVSVTLDNGIVVFHGRHDNGQPFSNPSGRTARDILLDRLERAQSSLNYDLEKGAPNFYDYCKGEAARLRVLFELMTEGREMGVSLGSGLRLDSLVMSENSGTQALFVDTRGEPHISSCELSPRALHQQFVRMAQREGVAIEFDGAAGDGIRVVHSLPSSGPEVLHFDDFKAA